MTDATSRDAANALRFVPDQAQGHYESYFLRANHPRRPLAFWIRYTLLSPAGRPDAAVAELWAVYFDGEADVVTAAKERHPLAACELLRGSLGMRIGASSLEDGSLRGTARHGEQRIGWALDYDAPEAPLWLLPKDMYAGSFPKAKSLVGAPLARFRGALEVDGRSVDVTDWVGSQNHNWGERHTDRYAWGQVAGFDDAPEAFLECASARVRMGPLPLLLPWLTVLVLRLDGEEHRLNALWTAVRASARLRGLEWHFASSGGGVRVIGHIHAAEDRFVGLTYDNPPGGTKICLNSKLAACELRVQRPGQPERVLHTAHRAAFEILGDEPHPDIAVVL